nr:hypothetical protein [Candidatus Sigynarchaeota archaeon]
MPQVRKYARKDDDGEHAGTGKSCNIKGCTAPAVRSLSREENESYLNDAGLQLKSDKERRITPCEAHYKLIKKKKKNDDKIKKSRFSAQNAPRIAKQTGKRIQDM